MASPVDNPRIPLTSAATPIVKYTEMRASNQQTSTTNISIPTTPTSVNRNSRLKTQRSLPINEYELRRMPIQQRRVVKKTLMANVGYRLGKRKELHIHR